MTINYEIKLTTLKLLGICRNNGSDAFLSNQTQAERNTQTTWYRCIYQMYSLVFIFHWLTNILP